MNLEPLQAISYGVYIVGAFDGERPVGCTINTCVQLTMDPPRIGACFNKKDFTLETIEKSRLFSVSILCDYADPALIATFGFKSSRNTDKYADFGYDVVDGVPMVRGNCSGRLVVKAEQFVDLGTHVLVIGEVTATAPGAGTPMTYSYFHEKIKPLLNKASAPADAAVNRFECELCGYVAETSDNELPEGYECPLCGAPRTSFHKL